MPLPFFAFGYQRRQRDGLPAASVIEALNWLVRHQGCANFQACWDTAPLDIRGVITTAWGADPFEKDSGWTCAD